MSVPRVLVTGACGFLGKSTVRTFLGGNYHIYALDLPKAFRSLPSDLLEDQRVELIQTDLNNESLEAEIPANIDYVVHLAGLASVRESIARPADYQRINVDGTVRLLDALRTKNIKKLVFSSSASVYGHLSSSVLDETDPVGPMSPYAQSKLSAEKEVVRLGQKHGFNTVILRFFNIYGPEQSLEATGIVNAFIKSILDENRVVIYGSGSRTRSLIHVRDCAHALKLACTSNTPPGIVINICSPRSSSVKSVADRLIEVYCKSDVQIEYRESPFPTPEKSGCSGKLARELLGFSPSISLNNGLTETFQYHLEARKSR